MNEHHKKALTNEELRMIEMVDAAMVATSDIVPRITRSQCETIIRAAAHSGTHERIKELEAQCWEPRQYGPAWFNSTKFAELIVRECAHVGGPEDSYTDEWFKAKADSADRIKKHFGVEE